MSPRGNKPVGRIAKALLAIAAGLTLIGLAVSIYGYVAKPSPQARSSLPRQAEQMPAVQP